MRNSVRSYARTDLGLKSHADEAQAAVDENFDAFRFGAGAWANPYKDEIQVNVALDTARSIRNATGPDCDLMIDCGGIFSQQAAYRLIDGLRDVHMFFVKNPVNINIPRGLTELRSKFPDIRIAAGERLVTR